MGVFNVLSTGSVRTDVKKHIFLIAGQSNTLAGQTLSSIPDEVTHPAILTFDLAGVPQQAQEPLPGPDARSNSIGFALAFAKAFIAKRPEEIVGLVHNGFASTGLVDDRWTAGTGDLHNQSIARVNQVLASNPGYVLSGILWHQGETDGSAGRTQTEYADALDLAIASFRSNITGAENTPFVLGEISDALGGGTLTQIKAAIADTPNRVARSTVIASGALPVYDGVHFNASSQRTMGTLYEQAIESLGI